MTPEQRLTKIENLLQTITEIQAKHEVDIGQLKESQKKTDEQLASLAETVGGLAQTVTGSAQTVTGLAQTVAGLAQTVKGLAQSVNRLSDMQERTEARLISLIEHIDRIAGRVEKLEK